jgi:hypothetical protein
MVRWLDTDTIAETKETPAPRDGLVLQQCRYHLRPRQRRVPHHRFRLASLVRCLVRRHA